MLLPSKNQNERPHVQSPVYTATLHNQGQASTIKMPGSATARCPRRSPLLAQVSSEFRLPAPRRDPDALSIASIYDRTSFVNNILALCTHQPLRRLVHRPPISPRTDRPDRFQSGSSGHLEHGQIAQLYPPKGPLRTTTCRAAVHATIACAVANHDGAAICT
jgi:hypothetical protein